MMKSKLENRVNKTAVLVVTLFILFSSFAFAADVITDGSFASGLSNWGQYQSGDITLSWDAVDLGSGGGTAMSTTTVGKNIGGITAVSQSLGTVNATDDVFLSFWWYKLANVAAPQRTDLIVRIIKPSGDSTDIWTELNVPGSGTSLTNSVTNSDVSSFFDQDGTYTIRFVSDLLNNQNNKNGNIQSNFDNIIVDVQAVVANDPPVVTDIPDQTIAEGASFTTITLDNYVSDPDNTDAEMTWSYSGNTGLIVDITNRVATITTPNTDWNGAETITFRATDPGSQWDEDPALFTVTAQNDPPVVTDIPDQTIAEGASFTTITLDNYVSDIDNSDAEMTWSYTGNTELIVDITNRIATITTPNADWNGAETITFRATDPGSLWDEDPALFMVTAQNDPPVVTDIPDQTIAEGASFTTITLDNYVSDIDNSDAEMTWSYSGNTELIVDITSRIATITTPSPTWTGAETITFRATDPGSLWDEAPALFTVTAQNDPPVVTDIPDQTIAEGASFTTITLDNYVFDPDNTDAEMTWSYSGNTELIVDITNRIATITTPDADWNGAETITFRATDPGSQWDEDPALFTVTAQNDPPAVSGIPDQTIAEGASFTTITLDNYVSDPDNSDAEMTWSYSGNTELIVDITNRVATITTPNADWNGAETITFRATDPGSQWDEDPALFTVTAQNDPPVVTDIPDQTIAEGASFTTITLDNYVSDPDNSDAEMTWSYSGNTELIVDITSRIATITTPNADWNGAETITFRATDPGSQWDEDPALFTVTAQNDPPTVTAGATVVSVSPVNRIGSGTTIISTQFTDIDQPSVGSFTVTFKIRKPNDITELTLVNAQTNGNGGLTIIDNGGGSYTASYSYDPDDAQTVGLYDLYFEVSDGTANATDGYLNNEDELLINEIILNSAPTIIAGNTSVAPGSIERAGAVTTTLSVDFTDTDLPGVGTFSVTFKVKEQYGTIETVVADALQNGQSGLVITDGGGGSYTATIDWDPAVDQILGYYDLYCLVFDGTDQVIDGYSNNADELLLTGTSDNVRPVVPSDNTYASPWAVERIGANPTTLGAIFTDTDAGSITAFKVSFKLREPDNVAEIVLADNIAHGAGGVTIADLGAGVYEATISWDPGDAQTLGYYDLYFHVTDNIDSSFDGFSNNLDELQLYDAISNNAPTLTAGATSVSPNSINRIGSEFTNISCQFADIDLPGTGAFTITIKVRDQVSTEYTLVNAAKHKEQGLRVKHLGGANYEASFLWDPDISQRIDDYDLYFYVEDNNAASVVDNYDDNLTELTVTSSAITGDGNLLHRSNTSDACGGATAGCHNLPGHNGYDCLDCHTSHETSNIFLIKENILVDAQLRPVDFRTRGIGDINNPDPVAGTWSGTMADSTDNVFTGICEVCHDDRVGHHRFDGSQPGGNHNDAAICTTCHPHADGFANTGGGEPTGGDGCGCHASFATTMATGAIPYHHKINSENASYIVDDKTCLMCHVHHDIFNPDQNPGFGARAKNLRADISTSVVQGSNVVLLNSDYQSSGSGGICLSCHTTTQTKTFSRPDGTTETMAITKADFDASNAHNYNATSTFSDASTFNANCVKCHNDNTTKSYQSSANKFALHNSDYDALLDTFNTVTPSDPLEENVCYGCHSGSTGLDFYSAVSMTTSSQNIQTAFGRTYSHPTETYTSRHSYDETAADLGDGNRHAECGDCHDPHGAQKGTHDGTSNLVSGALKGTWGVDINNWPDPPPTPTDNANLFDSFTSGDYTVHNPATKEYQICLKCHSNYVTLPSGSPNIAEEINPNYPSSHAIVQAGDNAFCNTTTMNEPWGTNKINYCSDCHRSDTPTDPEGPHGSNADHLLVATIVSNSTVGTPLCDVCHKSSVYWDGGASPSDYDDHPATQGQHLKAPGCFSCHMWDHSSTAALGLPTADWPGGYDNTASLPPPTRIWIHGQNRKWVYNEQDGSAGTQQPVENFINGFIANMDHGANRCWTETCKVHSNKAY